MGIIGNLAAGAESSLLLVVYADSGIREARDLDGRKVAVWSAFSAQPQALFERLKINPKVVEQGASLGVFLWGGVDVNLCDVVQRVSAVVFVRGASR
ncbi:MAG: hypothetical protein JJT75_14660 [Opitutales bacterium]|nr:hypothetical protein [Opitutales bacterium]